MNDTSETIGYLDSILYKKGKKFILGVDEAGRGPIAGCVVAGAVSLEEDRVIEGINDSKKLSPQKRKKLFEEIIKKAKTIGIGIVWEDLIDKLNIFNASLLAMKIAVEKASEKSNFKPEIILVDGIFKIPHINICPQKPIKKGDSKSVNIAAASIVAKVVRDSFMEYYDEIFPGYGFKSHKGYATKKHIERLKIFGPCKIHRKSFSPVSTFLR